MDYIITSAAIYFEPSPAARVPLTWFISACQFLGDHGLACQQFDIVATGFPDEGVHDVCTSTEKLTEALMSGGVETLNLYSGLVLDVGRFGWRAMLGLDMPGGLSFWGVDECAVASPGALLKEAFRVVHPIVNGRYGIGFRRRVSQGPDSYAAGAVCVRMDEVHELFEPNPTHDRADAWLHEGLGLRRHLRGLFRGAYPASILSSAHVSELLARESLVGGSDDAPTLALGTLSRIDQDAWLWELCDAEIPVAEVELRRAGLLIGGR